MNIDRRKLGDINGRTRGDRRLDFASHTSWRARMAFLFFFTWYGISRCGSGLRCFDPKGNRRGEALLRTAL